MMSFGVDLAESAQKALQEGFSHALPARRYGGDRGRGTSYYQQKQIQGRNPNAEIPPQQKMLMRLVPGDVRGSSPSCRRPPSSSTS